MHTDLIVKINNAKNNTDDMNILIEEYMPFIKSELYKSKSYNKFEIDDLISIGMLAFSESVNKYDQEKGNFISFSSKILKLRVIDFYRSQAKYDNEILDKNWADSSELSIVESGLNKRSIEEFSESELNLLRREEIMEFKEELIKFSIDFVKLKKSSPRKKELRKMCFEIADYIIENEELQNKLKIKKTLDLEKICKKFEVHRKKIERARSYIIAIVIILDGDYMFIRDYINWR
ncbi:MAG: sigma factor [Acidaminobacteraceae bacterium]